MSKLWCWGSRVLIKILAVPATLPHSVVPGYPGTDPANLENFVQAEQLPVPKLNIVQTALDYL